MTIAWEDAVPGIIERSGLYQRPSIRMIKKINSRS